MFNSRTPRKITGLNSMTPKKTSGTIVMTMTYGFSGQWGEGCVNATVSSTLQCDFENQEIVVVVKDLRKRLISELDESLRTETSKQRFGIYAQRIFDLYHVISEAQMFIP